MACVDRARTRVRVGVVDSAEKTAGRRVLYNSQKRHSGRSIAESAQRRFSPYFLIFQRSVDYVEWVFADPLRRQVRTASGTPLYSKATAADLVSDDLCLDFDTFMGLQYFSK